MTNGTDQDSVSERIPNRQRLSRDFIASNFSSDTRKSYRSLDREDHPILPTRARNPNRNSNNHLTTKKHYFKDSPNWRGGRPPIPKGVTKRHIDTDLLNYAAIHLPSASDIIKKIGIYQEEREFCSSQPSMVHWLSSSIFPCSFGRSLSRYGNIRPNLHFFSIYTGIKALY